jgi:hypothetical protein
MGGGENSRNKVGALGMKSLNQLSMESTEKQFNSIQTPFNGEKRLKVKPLLIGGKIRKTEKA